MPCRSDSPEDNREAQEIESRKVAILLIHVFSTLNRTEEITQHMRAAAEVHYGNLHMLDTWTALLCSTLRKLTAEELALVYDNPKEDVKTALADWWECHQEWDRKREAQEKERQQNMLEAFKTLSEEKQLEIIALLESKGLIKEEHE